MQCAFLKQDGEQCEAYSMAGSKFCYAHNPEVSLEDKKVAQAKGGKGGLITVSEPLPPIVIKDPNGVVDLITDTIDRVRAGTLDVKTANCIGVLSGHLIKAYEVAKLNDRVEIIERVIMEKRTTY